MWNASHLAVRLCALRHWKRVSMPPTTIPPPPSYEGHPHCTKDKNRSPFHGEKPLMIKWFLGRRLYQISQTILHGRDAILRVRTKWLIFNMILQLWADVKYHVPTGFGFSPKGCFLCFLFLCPQHLSTEHKKRRRNSAGVCRLFLWTFVYGFHIVV